ncbi:hypothetical protein C8J57DRAFT_1345588 [Mycena rebaudengoi]|nr:hypothetical protein C8J57DRAFT_1345588 [Mycena rebaudengoi]
MVCILVSISSLLPIGRHLIFGFCPTTWPPIALLLTPHRHISLDNVDRPGQHRSVPPLRDIPPQREPRSQI